MAKLKKLFRNPNYCTIISILTLIVIFAILFNFIIMLEQPTQEATTRTITAHAIQETNQSKGTIVFYTITITLISSIIAIALKLFKSFEKEVEQL